jgi:hypothetical protein
MVAFFFVGVTKKSPFRNPMRQQTGLLDFFVRHTPDLRPLINL